MTTVLCVAGGVLLAGLVAVAIGCAIGSILYINTEGRPAPKDTPKRRHEVGDSAHTSIGDSYEAQQVTAVSMLNAGAWSYEMLPDGHPLKAAGLAAKASICRSDDDVLTFDAYILSSLAIAIGEDLGPKLERGDTRESVRQCAREWWPDLTDLGFDTALTTDRLNCASWRV